MMKKFLSAFLSVFLLASPAHATMVNFGETQWPSQLFAFDANWSGGFNTNAMNSLNEYGGCVFQLPAAVTVRKVGVYVTATSSFIGTASAGIETITDTTGNPSGTPVGTFGTFTPAATTFFWVTLGADASLSANTPYFAGSKVTAFTSGSYTQAVSYASAAFETGYPYAFSGSSTKADSACVIGLEDDSGNKIKIMGAAPATAAAAETWASNSNPDRRGVRFQIAAPARLKGVAINGDHDQDMNVIFYASDGATATTMAYDGSIRSNTGQKISYFTITPTSLAKATWYRIVILPTTTTSGTGFYTATVATASDLDCWGPGQNFMFTTVNGTPTGNGDWTNTDTKAPIGFSLIFDQFDDGTGSGGSGGSYTFIGS